MASKNNNNKNSTVVDAPNADEAVADDNVADRPASSDAGPIADNAPETGFTEANVGDSSTDTAVKETDGLRKVSYDEATNLRTALDNVIGYHMGTTYRHDFENGLLTLRLFGLSINEDRADTVATQSQQAVLGNEGEQVAQATDEGK